MQFLLCVFSMVLVATNVFLILYLGGATERLILIMSLIR